MPGVGGQGNATFTERDGRPTGATESRSGAIDAELPCASIGVSADCWSSARGSEGASIFPCLPCPTILR
eukprot:COSAG06_NODE_95_length_24425_cov_882.571035_15_plen_69_part_00